MHIDNGDPMRHIRFTDDPIEDLNTAILIKTDALRQPSLEAFYIKPLADMGVDTSRIFAMNLKYNKANKAPAKESKEYVLQLMAALEELGIKTLYIADGTYFKYITGAKKVENAYGYIFPCAVKGYEHINCIYGTNYNAISYNEQLKEKLDISINTLAHHLGSKDASVIGDNVLTCATYPNTVELVAETLEKLHYYKQLAIDVETFSLRFYEAGIGTISFAWDKHSGTAFAVDYGTSEEDSKAIRALLKKFFLTYQGDMLFFNVMFDAKILIYNLFMEDPADYKGMRQGIKIFGRADDAMYYGYLALNSTQDIEIGLKVLAYPYLGAWGVDVNDITQIPLPELLEYNLKDSIATMYVQEVYLPKVVADEQLDYYNNMLKPSVSFALEMGLVGLPLDAKRRDELAAYVEQIRTQNKPKLRPNTYVRASFQ